MIRDAAAQGPGAFVATDEEVAETVMFVLGRPLTHRILEIVFRPVIETSRG